MLRIHVVYDTDPDPRKCWTLTTELRTRFRPDVDPNLFSGF